MKKFTRRYKRVVAMLIVAVFLSETCFSEVYGAVFGMSSVYAAEGNEVASQDQSAADQSSEQASGQSETTAASSAQTTPAQTAAATNAQQESGSAVAASAETGTASTQTSASESQKASEAATGTAAASTSSTAIGTETAATVDTAATVTETSSTETQEQDIAVTATCVDQFGVKIAGKYTGMALPSFDSELKLDDTSNPPVKNVSIRKNLFRVIQYDYVNATYNGAVIKALKKVQKTVQKDQKNIKVNTYAYTTNGSDWSDLDSDAAINFVYSKHDTSNESVYEYDDANVHVTATLQDPDAIPADAQFVVTPVTSSTKGYDYDAYMSALNQGASDGKNYDASNTMLYDMAFLAQPVDDNGTAVAGDKVEYQPESGKVNVSITFKKQQLSSTMNAGDASDVEITHLPLIDQVKKSVDTTADATNLSAKDIQTEDVSAVTALKQNGQDKVNFNLGSFSLIAVSTSSSIDYTKDFVELSNPINNSSIYYFDNQLTSTDLTTIGGWSNVKLEYHYVTDDSETFTKVAERSGTNGYGSTFYNDQLALGIAGNFHLVSFGNVSTSSHVNGDILAAGTLSAGSNFGTNNYQEVSCYAKGNYSKVNENTGSSTTNPIALGNSNTIALTDNNNYFSINGTKVTGKIIYRDSTSKNFIDTDTLKSSITSTAAQLAANTDQGVAITNDSQWKYYKLSDPDGFGVVNLTGTTFNALNSGNGIQLTGFESGHNGTIIMNVNCSDLSSGSTLSFPKDANIYMDGQLQGVSETTDFKAGKVIWNFINSSGMTINTAKDTMTGCIIAPNATVNSGKINGTIIANNIVSTQESHRTDFTGKTVGDSTSFQVAKAFSDNNWPSGTTYDVTLTPLNDSANTKDTLNLTQSAPSGKIGSLNYSYLTAQNGKTVPYYYEIKEKAGSAANVTYDSSVYYVRVDVTYSKDSSGNTAATIAGKYYYKASAETSSYASASYTSYSSSSSLTFTNTYSDKGSAFLNKTIAGYGTAIAGAKFNLFSCNGTSKTGDAIKVTGSTGSYSVSGSSSATAELVTDSNGGIAVSGLAAGKYVFVETAPADSTYTFNSSNPATGIVTVTAGLTTESTTAGSSTNLADVTNTKASGSAFLNKTITGESTAVKGAHFSLYLCSVTSKTGDAITVTGSAGSYAVSTSSSAVTDLVTDTNGEITVTGLTAGKYIFVETAAADSTYAYDASNPATGIVTVTAGLTTEAATAGSTTNRANLTNTKAPGSAYLNKTLTGTKMAIQGAKFNLFSYDGKAKAGDAITVTGSTGSYAVSSGSSATAELVTDSKGVIAVSGLAAGQYVFVETAPADSTYTFNSSNPATGIVTVTAGLTAESTTAGSNTNLADVTNTKAPGSAFLNKTITGESTAVKGAHFSLYLCNGVSKTGDAVKVTGSAGSYAVSTSSSAVTDLVTDTNGEIAVSGLTAEKYIFVETAAADSTYAYDASNPVTGILTVTAGLTTEAVTAASSTNRADVTNAKAPGSAYLNKTITGIGTAISGAKFNLFSYNGSTKTGDAVTVTGSAGSYAVSTSSTATELVTGSKGEIAVSGLVAGKYIFVETAAADSSYAFDSSNPVTGIITVTAGLTTEATTVGSSTNRADVTNTKAPGSAYLNKTLTGSTTAIAGAKFALYSYENSTKTGNAISVTGLNGDYALASSSSAAGATTELVTGSKGQISVSGLAAGQYIFVETAAADSTYVYDAGNPVSGAVTVTAGLITEATTPGSSTNRADVTNTKAIGSAYLNKTITGIGTAISGAKFNLFSYNGSTKTGDAVKVTGSTGSYAVSTSSTATELVTGSKGEIAVSGLAAGKYIFVETAAADSSYDFDSSNPVTGIITVTAGLTTEATTVGSSTNRADVTNTKAPGAAFLNKTITGENTAIAGAKFALYSYANSNKTGNAISVTGSNGDYTLASSSSAAGATTELVTGSKGQISVSGLAAGQYIFVETAAADSTYVYNASNPVSGAVTVTAGLITEATTPGSSTNRADVTNAKAPGSAYLNKTITGIGTAISGAKFNLFSYNGSTKTGDAVTVTGSAGSYAVSTSSTATELVTGSKGEIAVSGLAAGKYIFVETAAADSSYVFDSSNPITGIITVTAGLTTEATTVGSSTNRADVTNTKAPGAAFLNKTITGENTAIAGAKFALYSYENSAKTGNAISVTGSNGDYALASSSSVTGAATELVTGSKGQITVSGLTAGQYVFVETAAANSTYAFDSSNPVEGIVTVTAGNIVESSSAGINTNRADVSNKKAPGSAYLNKTVFGTGVAIQGVKFSLYQYDGSSKTGAAIAATGSDGVYMASSSGSVTEFVTNSQGKIIVNGLKEGQYIFVETAAANSTYAFDSNNPATGVVTVTAGTTVEAATAGSSANRADVTNNELTSVKVTKAWIDNNNADDLRPASVNVQLFAGDQVQGNTVTLSTSNNWNYTWTNLQKYDSKGNTIAYTVKELTQNTNSIVDDQHNFNSAYLTSYAKGEDGNFIISNIHSASAEFTIAATKALSGKTLQKDEFSFTLYANNTVAGQTVTTQAATYKNNADGTLYQTSGDGKGIVLTQAGTYSYTLVENSLSETGLTYDTSAYTFTLTASSQNSTGAADGKLHLALSGSSTSITMDSNTNIITLANRNSSKATFNNTYSAVGTLKLAATKAVIDKDKSKIATQNTFNFGLFKGTAETGTVIATGTSASAGINDIYGITFTGTGSYATGNNGEIRLSAGTNQLYTIAELDGNGKTVTRNEQSGGYTYDSTQYQFTADVKDNGDGYLQFTNINGATAGSSSITLSPTYTKGITTLNLSASSQNNNAGVTASFINQYNASGSLKMLASKILVNDSGNSVMALTDSSGKLKYDFTFDILEGSTVVSTGKIANFDGSALGADLTKGTIAFEPISYTSEGEHIYTVEETSKDGNGITRDRSVYNLYVVVTDQKNGSLQVAEYTDAAHKNSVALTANGTVYTGTVAEASKVTAGLSGLKENASFINLYKAEDASLKITATKYLEGASLPTGSNAFQFNLLKVSETGWENWTKSDISAILSSIFNNGQTKTYTVDSSSPSKGLITFDNLSYTDKMIGQTFNYVVYESSGDSQYTASDAVYKFSVTVVDNGNGTLGLAVKDTGNNILNVSNDTLALAQLAADKTNDFINTYDSKDLSVTKSFLGDITDTLAGTVTVQLYTYDPSHLDQTPAAYKDATGNSYIHVFTAGTKNSDGRYHWTQDELSYKFAGLPKYDSAHEEIHYCVKEINPESGYEVRYYNADGTTINTNAYSIFGSTNTAKIDNCEETALTGTKTWNDNSNLYGVRPSAIKVTLLQNGQVYQVKDQNGNLTDDSQIISANNAVSGNSNAWTYSFGSIPLYDLNGQTYKYTVEETYADTSATSTSQFLNYYVAGTSQTGLTSSVGYISDSMDLVNTLKTVSISGSKVWNDSNNASGARPSSITVNLYRNGSPYTLNSIQVSKTVTADANGNWSFSFTDLPMYELTYTTGGAIALTPNIYSVGETAVSNYTTAITGSMANGYIITNTHQTSGGRAYLVKVASNDTNLVLEGATFGLYKSDGTLINYYTSNSSGVVSASNLAAGSYYFQETGAPSGYGVNGSQFSFTISTSDYESGNSIYVGKVTDTVTTTTTTTTTTTSQSSVLGARRDLQTPEDNKGEVLGATRAPKTSDSSKALLWMLVMGASGLGAAAVMAQRRKELKQRNEKSATDQTRKL